jgi:hypothetical protein
VQARSKKKHWGEWVIARSRVVGMMRNQDLARSVGCTPQQLSRWIGRSEPPRRLLKGFDEAIASALVTSRRMVFSDWDKYTPEEADAFWNESMAGRPWEGEDWKGLPPEARARVLIHHLHPDLFEKWIDYGITLIDASEYQEERAIDIRKTKTVPAIFK